MKESTTQRWSRTESTHGHIQEVLMGWAWVLGGHPGGAHEMSMSPGRTWLPLGLSATWSSWAGNTKKRDIIMKGTLCRLRRTMWLGPPQHYIASDSIDVHNAEGFKGTYFHVLWVAWFFITGLMSNGRALFMCRRNISRNTDCWHQREAGNQGRSNPAQQKTYLLPKKLMGC